MIVSGSFIDSESYTAVPGVSVALVDRFGASTGVGVIASDNGRFSLRSDLSNSGDRYYLLYVTSVGYEPALIDPEVFSGTDTYALDRAYQDLSEVVVTPGNSNSPSPVKMGIGGWLLVGALVYALAKGITAK